jgi:hypothetical protein
MSKTIYLFPNTGHQYYFLPLALDVGSAAADVKKFEDLEKVTLLQGSASGRIGQLASQAQWREADQARWLRWRYGDRIYHRRKGSVGTRVFGIWIAIETNLGNVDRGYVWEVDRHPQQDDPTWMESRARQAQGLDDGTPYYRTKASRLPDDQALNLVDTLGLRAELPDLKQLELVIVWPRKGGDIIPVHLVVDFGNSRTIVLALEERPVVAEGSLRQICRPIQFGSSLEDASATVFLGAMSEDGSDPGDHAPESWFVLREPPFAGEQFEPEKVTMNQYFDVERSVEARGILGRTTTTIHTVLDQVVRRVPQMFLQLSPAVIGPEAAQALGRKNLVHGGRCYLSSPKRYAWDTDPVGTGGGAYWTMLPGTGRVGGRYDLPQMLGGEMLRFLPEQRARRAIEDPTQAPPPVEWEELEQLPMAKPKEPNFSRSDSLIWTALSIIEHANQQINSEAFRRNFEFTIPRRLASITVTRPSGWTRGEIRAYWAAWREARNIFYWSREPYWDDTLPYREWEGRAPYPEIDMLLDEGIASQLAIIYSEIRHFGERGRDWIRLFGKRRGESETIRVMTIDIGGGSTDTSVVEYRDALVEGAGSELTPRVLLNDSTTFAGDRLALDLIERVLLPTIGARFRDNPDLRRKFSDAMVANDDSDKVRLALITRTVFMPMVRRWFEDIEKDRRGNPSEKKRWSPLDSGANAERVAEFNQRMERLGLGAGLLQMQEPFPADYEAIERIIEGWVRRIADLHARIIAAYGCDLVVVAGKPSELPQVKSVLQERLPIDLHRLLFAYQYFAGDWFPCTPSDYVISDAKMVTAAGAALYTAVTCDARRATQDGGHGPLLRNFRMHDITDNQEPARNFWGRIGTDRRAARGREVFLQVGQDVSEPVELSDRAMIGRARFPGEELEPVYEFRLRNPQVRKAIAVRFRRVSRDGERTLPSEELQLELLPNDAVGPDDVELKLRTLPSREEHWFDRGRFEVRWDTP